MKRNKKSFCAPELNTYWPTKVLKPSKLKLLQDAIFSYDINLKKQPQWSSFASSPSHISPKNSSDCKWFLPSYLLENQWISNMQQLQKMMQKFPPKTIQESKVITIDWSFHGNQESEDLKLWTDLTNIQTKSLKLLPILFPWLCRVVSNKNQSFTLQAK